MLTRMAVYFPRALRLRRCVTIAQGTQLGIESLAANSECMCVYACDCIVCVIARCERARASVVVMMGLRLSRPEMRIKL